MDQPLSATRIRKLYWAIAILILAPILAACSVGAIETQVPVGPTVFVTEPVETIPVPAGTLPVQVGEPTQQAGPTDAPEALPAIASGTSIVEEDPVIAGTGQTALSCDSPSEATPAMTEGPYYMEGSPERTSLLEEGMSGTKLVITGYVLETDCQPLPGTRIDFWQTDAGGQYDNAGFRLRGHQFTAEDGSYRLETVVPGEYPGRTAHIHVRLDAPGGASLVTQLFFPGVQANESDRIFDEVLLLPVRETEDGRAAEFNFILDIE
jgi:protocatechuate 3,4-dioxygenase beta subunit